MVCYYDRSSDFFIDFEMLLELEDSNVGQAPDVISPKVYTYGREVKILFEKAKKGES